MLDDSTLLYLREIRKFPLLSQEEEKDLLEKSKQGDKQATNKLIESNLRLAVSIVKKYAGNVDVPFLDLVQEANLGLIKAIEKYDPERQVRFSTCASWYIKQSVLRSIENKSRVIRIPTYMLENIQKVRKAEQELTLSLGRIPTITEISEKMNIPEDKIKSYMEYNKEITSLDVTVGDDEESTLEELIPDELNLTPEQNCMKKDSANTLRSILLTLSPRENEIINYRYGLEDGEMKTLEETGNRFGLTKERIRQIENSALRKLRHPIRKKMLQEAFS